MRKFILATLAAAFVLASCEKETIIEQSNLPEEVKNYISTHFASHTITQSIKDVDGFNLTYDVMLSEGISLEFNRKKEIIDIDGISALPSSVIPTKISDYVTANYPTNAITDWEIDGKNQQIELSNGLDLEFNMAGDFLRIDN